MTEVAEPRLSLSVTAAAHNHHHDQDRPADAGHLLAVAAEDAAVGAGRRAAPTGSTGGSTTPSATAGSSFVNTGAQVRVIPQELRELPLLRDFPDDAALTALADRFGQQEYQPGDVIVDRGHPARRAVPDRARQGRQDRHRAVRRPDGARLARRRRPLRRRGAGRAGRRHLAVHRARHDAVHGARPAQPGDARDERAGRPAPQAHRGRTRRAVEAVRTSTARRRSNWPPGTTASRSCPAPSSTTTPRPASTSCRSRRRSCASTPASPTSTTSR